MKIYLAGPFWNGQERQNIERARDILRGRGFEVFVPMEHKVENDENMPNSVWGKAIFDIDKNAIFDCDVVVALYYGLYSDTGTAWEIGFANCLNKKIIIVHCDRQISSLMIANGANLNICDIEELNTLDFENINSNQPFSKVEQK